MISKSGLYNYSYNDLKWIRIKLDRWFVWIKVLFGYMGVLDNVMNLNIIVFFFIL